jgi:hypothetical protein
MSKATTAERGGRVMSLCSVALAAVGPVIFPKTVLVVVFIIAAIGFIVGIILAIYGKKASTKEQKKQKIKSLAIRKRNKEIDGILDTVETMDNYLYKSLPRAEKKYVAAHPTFNKTPGDLLKTAFSYIRIWLWFHPYILWGNSVNGFERLSEFADERQLGLEEYKGNETYRTLESRLDQKLRLKRVEFRNATYNFVALSYGLNSEILYFSILKDTFIGSPIYAIRTVRRLHKKRPQVVGNMLTILAVKLGQCLEGDGL